MKLIYPSGQATPEQMEPLLRYAIEGRKRVKDQLCRIDSTMAAVDFSYTRAGSVEPIAVHVLEEDDYPELYWRGGHGEVYERDGASSGVGVSAARVNDVDGLGAEKADSVTDTVVVPEFLRTLVFARPRGDDQFADCTFSPSLDMSR